MPRMLRSHVKYAMSIIMLLAAVPGWLSGADEPPLREIPASALNTREKVEQEFKKRDSDGNGRLTLAEFTMFVPEHPQGATHNFRIMDLDRNEQLSLAEFQGAVRFLVPDPWNELAVSALMTVQATLRAADRDGDGAWSRKEWPAAELHERIRPYGEIEFAKWDADADGKVTDVEVRRLVEYSYGVCLRTGEPARWQNGTVLDWTYLKHLDQNGDGNVSRTEFVARHVHSAEKNGELFDELNTNKDDHLSYAEITASPSLCRKHPIGIFASLDQDANGRLSIKELSAANQPVQNQQRALELELEAFDEDKDGQWNFLEYQKSPAGVLPFLSNLLIRKDKNQDGVIGWTEFHPVPQVQFAGIAWEVFGRFDRDHDLELTREEYDFPEARANVQVNNQQFDQWQPYSRHMVKVELRYFLAVCPLDAEKRKALRPVVQQILKRTVSRLATAQQQQQPARGAAAAADPQSLIGERLEQFAREQLSADAAVEYRRELTARAAQRQEATILNLVARLDQDLFLSEDQRGKIGAALNDKWQPGWDQQFAWVLQNNQALPPLPNDCVAPHLTSDQKAVWTNLSKMNVSNRNRVVMLGGGRMGRLVVVNGQQMFLGNNIAIDVDVENEDDDLSDLLPRNAPDGALRDDIELPAGQRVITN